MMLQNISAAEYVNWIAYFSVDWTTFKADQSPEQIQANLSLALDGKKKKKKPNAARRTCNPD